MVIKTFDQISLSGVKGILLDLDDTLYEYSPCHATALDSCCKEFLKTEHTSTRDDFMQRYNEARENIGKSLKGLAASHSRLLYFQKFFENYHGHTSFDLTLKFEKLYWDKFLDTMLLRPGAIEFLQNCHRTEIPICLVTDLTAEIQHRKIIKLNISKYLKFMVSSEEAGSEKPNPIIFKKALAKISLHAEDVIMIGDSPEKDIEGAKLMGIKAYQFQV